MQYSIWQYSILLKKLNRRDIVNHTEKSYKMVKKNIQSSFIERKSEFITYVAPVNTEDEALQFINGIRKKNYTATHNCFAYIIGESSMIQRSSDDGEPSGTAGIPILEVLRKEGLTNTVIVVTRYFGGIMLGAGGLIRAYSEGASSGISAAGIVTIKPYAVFNISIDYTYLGKIQHEVPRKQYVLGEIDYTDLVKIKVLCSLDQSEQLHADMMEWTNGHVLIEDMGIESLMLDESLAR